MASGAVGGDILCAQAATNANLVTATTWKAWLSDATTSPDQRFTKDMGPYILLNQTLVAAGWMGLSSGTLLHAIDIDENGMPSPAVDVWTGTGPDGKLSAAMGGDGGQNTNCMNWTSGPSDDFSTAVLGKSGVTDPTWTETSPAPVGCFRTDVHLFCFEQ